MTEMGLGGGGGGREVTGSVKHLQDTTVKFRQCF